MTPRNLAERLRVRRKPHTASAAAEQASATADTQSGVPGGAQEASGAPELRQRRDQLAKEFTELQWDLGGLAYEMASRDHFRLDVLMRQAARLQQVDAELAEAERILRLDEAGAAGACPSCGALYARGAVYCWQCGHDLLERREVVTPASAPQPAPAPPAAQPLPEPTATPPAPEQQAQASTQVAPLPPMAQQEPPDARVSFG